MCSIRLGENHHSIESCEEQRHCVDQIVRHHNYSRNLLDYDFALLKLTDPVTLNDHVGTICLPKSTTRLPLGSFLWETGWARTNASGLLSNVLKEVQVEVVSEEDVGTEWKLSCEQALVISASTRAFLRRRESMSKVTLQRVQHILVPDLPPTSPRFVLNLPVGEETCNDPLIFSLLRGEEGECGRLVNCYLSVCMRLLSEWLVRLKVCSSHLPRGHPERCKTSFRFHLPELTLISKSVQTWLLLS